jgi:hypothetical protein
MNCPGSVTLSEGLPDKSSPWAEEGTRAHEVLEQTLKGFHTDFNGVRPEMVSHARHAAEFILALAKFKNKVLVETRISLEFIHPEMFGTFDAAVVDHFGVLHVFDYKYGKSMVSPVQNLQMIFYGLGLAHNYDWNFKRVRLWIIQPRVNGYDGPSYWDISIKELMDFIPRYEIAVYRVGARPTEYNEGKWCHWCKAKKICPLKQDNLKDLFPKL